MVLILDGYNILKQMDDKSADRQSFIHSIEKYASIKNLKIMLIFDSGPFNYKVTELYGMVRVIYVGQGHTADEFITTYCANHPTSELVVVTSDRGIIQSVTHDGAKTLSAQEFTQAMKETLSRKSDSSIDESSIQISKLTDNADSHIDELMKYAAELPLKKE